MSEAFTISGFALGPALALAVVGIALVGAVVAGSATQRFLWTALGAAGSALQQQLDAADARLRGHATGYVMRMPKPAAVTFQTAKTPLQDGATLERAARKAGLTVVRGVSLELEGGKQLPLEACLLEGEEVRFALRRGSNGKLEALWVSGDDYARRALVRLWQHHQVIRALEAAQREGYQLVDQTKRRPNGDVTFLVERDKGASRQRIQFLVRQTGTAVAKSASRQRGTGAEAQCPDLSPFVKALGEAVPLTLEAADRIHLRRTARDPRNRGTPVVPVPASVEHPAKGGARS